MITKKEFDIILQHLPSIEESVKENLKKSVAPLFDFNDFMKEKLDLSDEGLEAFNGTRAKMYEKDIQDDLKKLYGTLDHETLSTRGDELKGKEREIVMKYMKLPVEELCAEYAYEKKDEVMASLSDILEYMLTGYEEAEKGMH